MGFEHMLWMFCFERRETTGRERSWEMFGRERERRRRGKRGSELVTDSHSVN